MNSRTSALITVSREGQHWVLMGRGIILETGDGSVVTLQR